jgi:hypothetical protein
MSGLEVFGHTPARADIWVRRISAYNITRTVDRIAVFPESGVPTNTMLFARDRDLRRIKYSATVCARLSK